MADETEQKNPDEMLDEFMGKFWALQQEAKEFGFVTNLTMHYHDPLNETGTTVFQHTGTLLNAVGMCEYTKIHLIGRVNS